MDGPAEAIHGYHCRSLLAVGIRLAVAGSVAPRPDPPPSASADSCLGPALHLGPTITWASAAPPRLAPGSSPAAAGSSCRRPPCDGRRPWLVPRRGRGLRHTFLLPPRRRPLTASLHVGRQPRATGEGEGRREHWRGGGGGRCGRLPCLRTASGRVLRGRHRRESGRRGWDGGELRGGRRVAAE